jgi:hypothetical protein
MNHELEESEEGSRKDRRDPKKRPAATAVAET